VYIALDPPFVVNFEAQQLVRFLQVTVQLMTRDPQTVELLHANDPVVRNDLLLLFGNQRYEVISTRAGKENLRKLALDTARHVVEQAGGKPDRVEAVYFTSFVMQ
jgi:flagellar protein FliL